MIMLSQMCTHIHIILFSDTAKYFKAIETKCNSVHSVPPYILFNWKNYSQERRHNSNQITIFFFKKISSEFRPWHQTMEYATESRKMIKMARYPYMWSSLRNSFEDRMPVDETYGCPIFKWATVTWLNSLRPGDACMHE